MCLILFAFNRHPQYRIVMAANRDEFYDRPTSGLHEWSDGNGLIAGRDMEQLGTWMGVSRSGRLAAITNYREGMQQIEGRPSRGHLVADYLQSDTLPGSYLSRIESGGQTFNGFNLMVGDKNNLWYYSNQGGHPQSIKPGVHGLSNHLLDTDWPKVQRGRQLFTDALSKHENTIDTEILFTILLDQTVPEDHQLPDTGVGIDKERMLAPMFITSSYYGTRSSSVLLMDRHGMVTFAERSWKPAQPNPIALETRRFSFRIS